MTGFIKDFQYFLLGIILLSNTHYLHYALMDIKENSKTHKSFVQKCLLSSLYIMFLSILYILKLFLIDTIHFFDFKVLITVIVICILFLIVTVIVYFLVYKNLKNRVRFFDKSVIFGFIITFSYTIGIITHQIYFSLVFIGYSFVMLSFFYNIDSSAKKTVFKMQSQS